MRGNFEKKPGHTRMKSMILVDTDILVDIQRQYPPAIAWLKSLGMSTPLAISGFSLFELMAGAENRLQMQRIKKLFKPYSRI